MSTNARKLTVGLLFVLLAFRVGAFGIAQDAGEAWEASVRPAVEPKSRADSSNASGDDTLLSQLADGAQRASNDSVLDNYLTTASFDEQQPPAPIINTSPSPSDGLDDCYRPICNFACPSVYVQVQALFFQRVPRTFRQPIFVNSNTDTTILSTSDLKYNLDPGMQATVGMRLNSGRTVEFDYFGLFSGNATATVVNSDPAVNLTFPGTNLGNVNVFEDIEHGHVYYSSSLQSFGLNLLCCCGCCDTACCGDVNCQSLSWFGGFRYINYGERLNITAQRTVMGGVEDGAYNLRTTNHLYGGQLGARLRRTSGRFGWDATGTAGIFGNDAQQTQSVTDFPNFQTRPTVSSSGGGVAFVGGANVSGLYMLNDVWNLRAGYSALWIEGLALAPDQLDYNFVAANGGSQLNHGGGLFLHGVNIGLEARW